MGSFLELRRGELSMSVVEPDDEHVEDIWVVGQLYEAFATDLKTEEEGLESILLQEETRVSLEASEGRDRVDDEHVKDVSTVGHGLGFLVICDGILEHLTYISEERDQLTRVRKGTSHRQGRADVGG